jgi:hypothetical protein
LEKINNTKKFFPQKIGTWTFSSLPSLIVIFVPFLLSLWKTEKTFFFSVFRCFKLLTVGSFKYLIFNFSVFDHLYASLLKGKNF